MRFSILVIVMLFASSAVFAKEKIYIVTGEQKYYVAETNILGFTKHRWRSVDAFALTKGGVIVADWPGLPKQYPDDVVIEQGAGICRVEQSKLPFGMVFTYKSDNGDVGFYRTDTKEGQKNFMTFPCKSGYR